MQKLIGFGDCRTSNIVAKIAEEEVAHVAVGVYWFAAVCQKMGRSPCPTFRGCLYLSIFYSLHVKKMQRLNDRMSKYPLNRI